MPNYIQAQTVLGIEFETTYGTYAAPTRFFPIKSESLKEVWNHVPRRLIRGIADNIGHVAGFHSVEGDITMELIPDVLPYFLYVSRNSIAKTGTDPYQYVTTPTHVGDSTALTKPSLSITVQKAGEVFGFVGCVVSSLSVTVEDGIPVMTISIIGSQEAEEAAPVPSFLATDLPYNAGQYTFQLPTATTVFDVETFTFTINDNAEPQFRLNNTGGAQWVKFGERNVSLEVTKDFNDRTEWDAFKTIAESSVTLVLTNGAKITTFVLPKTTRETFDIDGASDQGAPVMSTILYTGNYNPGTSKSYEITVAGVATNII